MQHNKSNQIEFILSKSAPHTRPLGISILSSQSTQSTELHSLRRMQLTYLKQLKQLSTSSAPIFKRSSLPSCLIPQQFHYPRPVNRVRGRGGQCFALENIDWPIPAAHRPSCPPFLPRVLSCHIVKDYRSFMSNLPRVFPDR